MALFNSFARATPSLVNSSSKFVKTLVSQRPGFMYASSSSSASGEGAKDGQDASPKSGGWLDRVFSPSRIHTGNEPHSRLLSAADFIYEMHYHDAKPDSSEDYIAKYEKYCQELITKTNNKAELVASFRVEIGNQDQFIHIWRYHDGYKQASHIHKILRTDPTLIKLNKDQIKDLRKRESQFMMSFSFWQHPQPAQLDSFYEMRSYVLRPGTMIEWANGWSKGIKHRDNAVAGFFSQIGQLYTVHHIWRYQDLQDRRDVRENAWRRPGWDECVSITVPNIVYLHSRWMAPNSFSPISLFRKPVRKSIEGQTVLITGSGHGLGCEMALRFAKRGANLVLVDINESNNEKVRKQAMQVRSRQSAKILTYKADIRDAEQVSMLAKSLKEDLGASVDILVNNAGIVQCLPFMELSPSMVERTFQVNTFAHIWMIKEFLPDMIKNGRGHVVAISSIAGLIGSKYLTDYCASKFAVVGLMESLDKEVHHEGANRGLHFTTICPSSMTTGMFKTFTSRFSFLLPVLEAGDVADQVVDAVLTNKSLVAVPPITLFFHRLSSIIPNRVNYLVQNFLDYGVKPHSR